MPKLQDAIDLAKDIRSKSLREAIKIAEDEEALMLRAADRAHKEQNTDLYEALESNAVVAARIAGRIRMLLQK